MAYAPGKSDTFASHVQMKMVLSGDFFGVGGRKGCFTENYLVFSLNERMPQITEMYLDKEDDVLDYCKKVIFKPEGKHKQQGHMSSEDFESSDDEDDMLFESNK